MQYDGITYPELVANALKGGKENEALWFNYLQSLGKRRDAERQILQDELKKHPGRTNDEILRKFSDYLQNNFPVPVLKQHL